MLDAKDMKILGALDCNARQANSQVARKVGLSKEVVNYRIKSLEKRGLITNYHAVIDTTKLGYMCCRLFIRFQNVNVTKEKEIIEYARNHKSVGWIVRTKGPWDLVFVIWSKTVNDFKQVCDEICFEYGQFFQNKIVSIATKIYHFKHNYLFGTTDYDYLLLGENDKQVNIDELDIKILSMLSKEGRIPVINLSNKLNVTPNTISYRIKNLIKQGVILGFKTGINSKLLGYQRYKIILFLQNLTKKRISSLIEYLRCDPNVIYITDALSYSDLEFEIDVKNNEQLYEMMNKLRVDFADIVKDNEICLTYEQLGKNYLPELNGAESQLK